MSTIRAFVLRMRTWGEHYRVEKGLATNRITIGWSRARKLITLPNDHRAFRDAIRDAYPEIKTNQRAGSYAGSMLRFIHGMRPEDRVLVPRGKDVFLAKIDGAAGYDDDGVDDDIAHYRPVEWMNGSAPFPRDRLPSRLQFCVGEGTRITCRDITTDLPAILALETGLIKTDTTFQDDLHEQLVAKARHALDEGKMNPKSFEYLLRDLFTRWGATEGAVRGGRGDKGADIVLEMPIGTTFLRQKVAVQAKYYPDRRPVDPGAVRQLVAGMEAEGADLGIVVTTSEFSDEAAALASECGYRIEFIDGALLASMIVEHGVFSSMTPDDE